MDVCIFPVFCVFSQEGERAAQPPRSEREGSTTPLRAEEKQVVTKTTGYGKWR